MIYQATKTIANAFNDAELKCSIQEVDSVSFVETRFTGDNCTITLRYFSTGDDNDVQVIAEPFAKYPESKFQDGYKMMNKLSQTYRYLKFTMSDEGGVCVRFDFPASLSTEVVGKVAVEMALRCVSIVNEAYIEIMKSIWR